MAMTPRSVFLDDLLTSEVRDLVPAHTTRVMVPCGATEAHGAAGLGTDSIIPEGLAARLAEPLGALVAPTVHYGVLRSLSRYPGSVSLKPETYTVLMMDVAEGLIAAGFRELIFMNGHAGNRGVLKDVAHDLHIKHDVFAMVYDWYMEPDDVTPEIYDGPGGHSGAGETGLVRAFRPEAAPDGLWKKEDAGTLNPALAAYPGPYPIILMEEDAGLPDTDDGKAGELLDAVLQRATVTLGTVLSRWEQLRSRGRRSAAAANHS